MADHSDQQRSTRRAVVATLVASVLLVSGGLLAVKRSIDEHLPRYPTHTPAATSTSVGSATSAPTGASLDASG